MAARIAADGAADDAVAAAATDGDVAVDYEEGGAGGDDEAEADGGDGDASAGGGAGGGGAAAVPDELAELQEMMAKMEAEHKALEAATTSAAADAASSVSAKAAAEQAARERDERSVFVGNVDFSATAEELGTFFSTCGVVERVTILADKFTRHPKGWVLVVLWLQPPQPPLWWVWLGPATTAATAAA